MSNRDDLELEKLRAEISKLMAETIRLNEEREKHPIDLEELRARVDKSIAENARISEEREKHPIEIEELRARVDKSIAETTKANKENQYHLLVVGASLVLAGASAMLAFVALAKLFL